MYGDYNRERLIDFYKEHESDIDLDDFNRLLLDLNINPIETIQEIEVVMRFKVDVSELKAFHKDSIEIDEASIALSRNDAMAYDTASTSGFELISFEVSN